MLPFGQVNQQVDLLVRKMGFQPVSWNIDSTDYSTNSNDCSAIVNAYRAQLGRLPSGWGKFVALQHDIVPCTLSTMDEVFNLIAQYNYTAVPMDACLGDSEPYLTCWFFF
jgi:peptidoglycan/xylan/chitin deacetylase (PgdA/CDA1 family)